MKLRYSSTSPYVRKVTATAIETGLDDRIERNDTNAWDPDTDLPDDNPLGKVPALTTDGGEVLYDSPVICEFLDSLHDGARLFPPDGGARWTALRRQALADGILDAAVQQVIDARKPDGERSPWWVARQKAVIARALDGFEEEVEAFGDQVTIGHITLGVALGYLDLRFPDEAWRRDHPALADWYEDFSARPSMERTAPKEAG